MTEALDAIVRDGLEVVIALAVGATLVAAILKAKRGQVQTVHCSACNRMTSRIYASCPRCGAALRTGSAR